jgi:hypothetical protein
MTDQTQKLLLLGAIGVGVFLLARTVSAAAPVRAVTQALTPQAPKEPGVVLQGKNYGAFIPFPDIGALLSSLAGTLKSTEDAGEVSVQPGQRMQFLGE